MNREISPATSLEKPTNVRYGVLGFVCALSMITYLDRVCFSSAQKSLVEALGLNSVADLYWAFFAFAFAYAAFEVPSGWLGDVYGPRKVIIRIVLCWSVFTALTGSIWYFTLDSGYALDFLGIYIPLMFTGMTLLVIIRFLFGMGEAGAYPNITRALHNWFPFRERAFAQGAVWMAGRMMGGLTHLVWLFLTVNLLLSWRTAFWLFGALGIVWCILFAWWFRNQPEEKPEVNAAERELITTDRPPEGGHDRVPWGKLLTSANLWILCMMYFCAAYGWYFNITYLPAFLEQQGVNPDDWVGAIYKGGPLWLGAFACLLGGWLSDKFIRRTGDPRWGRRLYGMVGHGLCALCMFGCLLTYQSPFLFFLSISFAAFFNDITMGPAWATCQDIGKRYAAIVAGCMNTIGNLGGALAGLVTGLILQGTLSSYAESLGKQVGDLSATEKAAGLLPGYQINFVLFGLVYVIAVVLWMRIDATKPVAPEAG